MTNGSFALKQYSLLTEKTWNNVILVYLQATAYHEYAIIDEVA